MRIHLINPPTVYEEQSALVEPLGLCYLSAVAQRAGHDARVHDLCDTRHADVGALFAALDAEPPDLVGFGAMTNAYPRALELARAVKARYGCPVVFGGWHVSGDPHSVREPAIDYVVVGEGEATFLDLLEHLERGAPPLEEIPGLAYLQGDEARVNAGRDRLRELGELPRPDRSDLPLHLYKVPALLSHTHGAMRTLTIQASRGCPYTCSFCQTPAVWGSRWTRREPAAVVDEIEELLETQPINSFWVRDEEFTVNRRWVLEICAEIVRRGLQRRATWGSFCRVDDIDRELLGALREAGYVYGFMGIDSGDPEARERLRKNYAQEQAERALALFRELDVTSHCGWIIGFPWDTRAGLEEQFAWLQRLPMDMLTITYALPFAGTEFGREMEARGLVRTPDWEAFSEKEPVVTTPEIPVEELKWLRARFIRRHYLRPRYAARLARRVIKRPSRVAVFGSMLWHHLRETEYFGRLPWSRRTAHRLEIPEAYRGELGAGRAPPRRPVASTSSTLASAAAQSPSAPLSPGGR